jgi:hypothetical protein
MRAYVITGSDLPTEPLTQQAVDALNYIYPSGKRAYSEEYVAQVMKWWDGKKWTGSPFFNAAVGQAIRCCDYIIDPKVKNAGHDVPVGFSVATHGLISVKGVTGHFCSIFCLAMEMFLYRNRRCAGCREYIPKKEWTSPEKFRGENYPKYRYCFEACKKKQEKLEFGVLSTEHVRRVLGMVQAKRRCSACNAELTARQTVVCGKAACRAVQARRKGNATASPSTNVTHPPREAA